MPLWLIGMMGSGKSRVGRLVADQVEVPFRDSDVEVESRAGLSIAELWDSEGVTAFRRLERQVVEDLAKEEAVIATGGGVVLDPDNVATLRATGLVVWLDADPATLAARVGDDPSRPLLAAGDARGRLTDLAAERVARYAAAAHARIRTEHLDPDQVAARVVELWNRS